MLEMDAHHNAHPFYISVLLYNLKFTMEIYILYFLI